MANMATALPGPAEQAGPDLGRTPLGVFYECFEPERPDVFLDFMEGHTATLKRLLNIAMCSSEFQQMGDDERINIIRGWNALEGALAHIEMFLMDYQITLRNIQETPQDK